MGAVSPGYLEAEIRRKRSGYSVKTDVMAL
jgi:hypothetical protein